MGGVMAKYTIGIDPGTKGSLCILDGDEILKYTTWDFTRRKFPSKVQGNLHKGLETAGYVYQEIKNNIPNPEHDRIDLLVVIEMPQLIHNPSTYGYQMAHIGALIGSLNQLYPTSFGNIGIITPSHCKKLLGFSSTINYYIDHTNGSLPPAKWKKETVADSYVIAKAGKLSQQKGKLRMIEHA
jgi:hypothetical protein